MDNPPDIQTELSKELLAIRFHFNIEEQMFLRGLDFAQSILEGDNKTVSMQNAFEITKDQARSRAGEFSRRKWVQELLRYLKPNEATLYIGEIETIIKQGMEMIRDPRRDDRVKIEAMKALQPYIKQQQATIDAKELDDIKESVGETIMEKMAKQISTLSANGKIVSQTGEIIEIEYVQ